jgi:hypothetical protein
MNGRTKLCLHWQNLVEKASSDIVAVIGPFVVLYIGKVLVANLPTAVTVTSHSLACLGYVACHRRLEWHCHCHRQFYGTLHWQNMVENLPTTVKVALRSLVY